MGVWQFIQDQVFGMKWLNELIGKGLSKLGLDCLLYTSFQKSYGILNIL